ncbi:MAG: dienelactone hydrolase family protein [Cypionkella sp.]
MSGQIRQAATADGTVKAWVFHPAKPTTTGIILYMDAFGPRPALEDMAERMAVLGHVVLLPDLFYRAGAYGPFDAATAFSNDASRAQLMGLIGGISQDMTVRDTATFLEMLSTESATGPVAAVGYCMGGARALNAAAAYPNRIKVAASFHGGNLASDQPDSPHTRVSAIKGAVYVGCAGVDRSFPPEQSAKLAQALREAELDHMIENFVGMAHGWCVADHSVYDAAGAERHWRRLETLFAERLAAD